MRGYDKGRFSFNIKGGRCEACKGDGIIKIEMHFLSDVYVPCEVCGGKRYNRETLEIRYKGKSIADILDMTINEAVDFFSPYPKIARKIEAMKNVGLGYITLGHPSTTLSGGEAQRISIARCILKDAPIIVLDEATASVDADNEVYIQQAMSELCRDKTVLVIAHRLNTIRGADRILVLDRGRIIEQGSHEELMIKGGTYRHMVELQEQMKSWNGEASA